MDWLWKLPDLVTMHFSYGGSIIDHVYVPALPNYFQELKDRIRQALESTDILYAKHGTILCITCMWSVLPTEHC